MFQNPRGLISLNWKSIVGEALRRRKIERMTQREHAALANVSIPTIADFDRGETTLSLSKAFDILRVVGLVDEPVEGNIQNTFARDAFERWRSLSDALPQGSPGRFPHGCFQFDYYLEGDLKSIELKNFEKILKKADTYQSRWVPFLLLQQQENAPYEVDGILECWLKPKKTNGTDRDASCCDFWRAAPSGRMFLRRGYKEDCVETFPAGSIFDTILPILYMGEVLLHSERLAALLQKDTNKPITVHFRGTYSGLNGRVLHAWANPFSNILGEGRAARSDEAVLEISIPAYDITLRLAEYLYPLVSSLYEKFGATDISKDFVQSEVKRLFGIEVSRF
jgi:transcriptional regulator with XRE-family HTH domain